MQASGKPVGLPWESFAAGEAYWVRTSAGYLCEVKHVPPVEAADLRRSRDLIVAAGNACHQVNPEDPMTAAQSYPKVVEALETAIGLMRQHALSIPEVDPGPLEAVLLEATGRAP